MKSIPKVRLILCACGCKQLLLDKDAKGRLVRFIYAHNFKKGPDSHNWKGGRLKDDKGYIRIWKPEHPRADSKGYVKEHIVIFEEAYNCCALKWADIHHINGIKDDNKPENLEGMVHGKHSTLTHTGFKYTEESKLKMRMSWYRVHHWTIV